jgi:hypothetical protein
MEDSKQKILEIQSFSERNLKDKEYRLYFFLEPHGQGAFLLICPLLPKLDRARSNGVDPINFWT